MTDPDEESEPGHSPQISRQARGIGNVRVPIVTVLGLLLSVILAYVFWVLITAFGPNPYDWQWVQPATAVAAVVLGGAACTGVLLWAADQTFARETRRARQQIGGDEFAHIYINGADSTVHVHANARDAGAERPSDLVEPDAQESMLTEIYSHGLAQAKLSFFISVIFAVLGSAVLLTGAGLAVIHAGSNGERYAAIVAQVSGAVINLLAGVFFLQSNRARKDMGAQGVMLRDDSRADRRLKAAGLLVDRISDEGLQNRVKAQMALQLVDSNAVIFPGMQDPGAGQQSEPAGAGESTPQDAARAANANGAAPGDAYQEAAAAH